MASEYSIIAYVLAAGRSRRMDRDKLALMSRNDISIIAQTIENMNQSYLKDIWLIAPSSGAPKAWGIAKSQQILAVSSSQMSDSVRSAIDHAVASGASHAMIGLGDMPEVTVEDLNRLLEVSQANPEACIVPTHDSRDGNPVIVLLANHADWIDKVEGDRGAKTAIAASVMPVINVECGPGVVMDIDTPEAYERYLRS